MDTALGTESVEGLLADLDTITDVAQAGVISRTELRLEEGDTRPVAIMYLDVVGFTDLARILSPESLSKLIDRTFRIFELTVRSYGGYCDKIVGDAALYVFPGHPNHPPACEASLRAAITLIDRTRQVSESLHATGLTLSVRIGISFGEVARQRVGGDLQQETVMGETVNIAQRLEATALPNTVQTTIRVLERAGELTISEKRGTFELKGFGPVDVHHVFSFKQPAVRLRGSFRRLTPLIGRQDALDEAYAKARQWLAIRYSPATLDITKMGTPMTERNRLLIIRGPTAVGKSRLGYELLEQLRGGQSICTATGHCTIDGTPSILAGELAQVAGIDAQNLPERWEELCQAAEPAVSKDYANRQRAHLPLLAHVLGCTKVDTLSIRQADPSSFVLEVKLALRACCELAAIYTNQPVILTVEDLQWMGELRDIISDLLEHTCLVQPLLIVATARPAYEHKPGQLREGEAYVINLTPLGREQGKEMMEALLPGLKLPPALEGELHEKASGIPYYYEEFARMLLRRNLVTETDGQFQLSHEIEDLAIPEDIRMLILGRLDQLEPDLRELVGRASVLGRSFLKGLLATFEEKLGTNTAGDLDIKLQALTIQHVLGQDPGDRYFFEHVLTREAAYGALLRTNRKVLHRIAAEVMVDALVPGTAAEWEILPELVRHLEEVGEYERAHIHACNLLTLMAHTGRYDKWKDWERRARLAWEQVRKLYPTKSIVSARLVNVQGWQHYCQGRMREARHAYEQALAIARREGSRKLEAETLNFLGTLLRNQGQLDESERSYSQSLQIFREVGNRLEEGTTLRNLGKLHHVQGRLAEAGRCYQQSLDIKREVGDRRGEGITLNNLGNLYKDQGRMDEADKHYEQSLKIKQETSDRRGEGITLCSMGMLHAEQGHMMEARVCYEKALRISREIGDRRREGIALNCLGIFHQSQNRMDKARACYEQSLAIRRDISDRDGEGATLTSLGVWYSDQGDIEEAEAMQLAALAIGRELGLRNLEGEVLAELADIYRKQGRLKDARQALANATELLTKLQDHYYLAIVHSYWAQLRLAVDNVEGARESLANAEASAAHIGPGPQSDLTRIIARTRQAIEEYGKDEAPDAQNEKNE